MKHRGLATIKPFIFSSSSYNHYKPLFSNHDYVSYPTSDNLFSSSQHYINLDNPSYGQKIHSHILKFGFNPNSNISIKLLILYLKSDSLKHARHMFNELPHRTLSPYKYIISGYLKHQPVEESFALVHELHYRGMPGVDDEVAKQVQEHFMKTVSYANIKIGSVLIDMFSKCGRIKDIHTIFDEMPKKSVFSWTSTIDGYRKNRYPYEALNLFSIMQNEHHIEPNFFMFLGTILVYTHVKIVDKSLEIFESMERDFMMKLGMEHYACIVDLLECTGRLYQAWEFVKAMSKKPNSNVWVALMSSCRLHVNLDMANAAANEIFKPNSNDRPRVFIILFNTLADIGKWDSVSELRETMKVNMISKDTGRS